MNPKGMTPSDIILAKVRAERKNTVEAWQEVCEVLHFKYDAFHTLTCKLEEISKKDPSMIELSRLMRCLLDSTEYFPLPKKEN